MFLRYLTGTGAGLRRRCFWSPQRTDWKCVLNSPHRLCIYRDSPNCLGVMDSRLARTWYPVAHHLSLPVVYFSLCLATSCLVCRLFLCLWPGFVWPFAQVSIFGSCFLTLCFGLVGMFSDFGLWTYCIILCCSGTTTNTKFHPDFCI